MGRYQSKFTSRLIFAIIKHARDFGVFSVMDIYDEEEFEERHIMVINSYVSRLIDSHVLMRIEYVPGHARTKGRPLHYYSFTPTMLKMVPDIYKRNWEKRKRIAIGETLRRVIQEPTLCKVPWGVVANRHKRPCLEDFLTPVIRLDVEPQDTPI